MGDGRWLTPFTKQCFVTASVAMNVAQFGLVMAFTAILLPQLRNPDSLVLIDDTSGSWIAAVPVFGLVLGNFTVPTIMARYGRKIANLVSVLFVVVGWFTILGAQSITLLLIARLLQGLSMGMSTSLGSILVGEYTSPKNRGPFLSTMSLSMSIGTLVVHTVGSYVSWKITALVCALISVFNLIIVICSPESPSWLASQGKYEECERVFHWLRGDKEEDELKKMIEASQISRESKTDANIKETFSKKFRRDTNFFSSTVRKKEFYKPIIIVIHMYMIANWGGVNLISAYTLDTIHNVIGTNEYDALLIITVDIQRIIFNAIAVYVIRRVKRRTMFFSTILINFLALASIGAYTYAKIKDLLPFDHPVIGAILIHIHTMSVVTGSLPLPLVIAGEIFPLQYRSLAGGISAFFFSVNFFITVKTVLLLFKTVGFYGTYFIYAGVLGYCLVVSWFVLPETKDRTLQDIEEEFRGRKMTHEELKSAQSLNTVKASSG